MMGGPGQLPPGHLGGGLGSIFGGFGAALTPEQFQALQQQNMAAYQQQQMIAQQGYIALAYQQYLLASQFGSLPQVSQEPDIEDKIGHEPTPDFHTVLYGWRVWGIEKDTTGHWELRSWGLSGVPNRWEPRKPKRSVGQCRPSWSHIAPHRTCSCGIYAFKDFHEDLKDYEKSRRYLVGRVALWGVVIEHEGGYRAQYAYPVEFSWGSRMRHPIITRQLERRYGMTRMGG